MTQLNSLIRLRVRHVSALEDPSARPACIT